MRTTSPGCYHRDPLNDRICDTAMHGVTRYAQPSPLQNRKHDARLPNILAGIMREVGGLPPGSDPGRFSPRPERKCRSQANRVPRAGAARSRPLLPVRYALRGPSLAPRGIKWRSLPGLDGRCVARCWYPQLPNRCRTGWSRKASYLLARDRWFESASPSGELGANSIS